MNQRTDHISIGSSPHEMTLPSSCVGLPDEETMSCEDGLVENHYYRDLRWIDSDDFERIWKDEQVLLDSDIDLESDEAIEAFEDNEVMLLGLDPGVASTVAAIAVIGGCPVTSCSGGGQPHYEEYPLVFSWLTKESLELIIPVAIKHKIELVATSGGILLCTPDILDVSFMRSFARDLFDTYLSKTGGP